MLWLTRRAHARAQPANAQQSARPPASQTVLPHEPDLSVGRSTFLFASAEQAPCSCLGVYLLRVRTASFGVRRLDGAFSFVVIERCAALNYKAASSRRTPKNHNAL